MSCPINGTTYYRELRKAPRYTRKANREARRYGYTTHAHLHQAAKVWHEGVVQRVYRGAARGG